MSCLPVHVDLLYMLYSENFVYKKTTGKICLKAEETFRCQTSGVMDVKKINTRQMVKDLIKNIDVISAYSVVVDTFGNDDDIKYPPVTNNTGIVFQSSLLVSSQRYYN